MHKVNVNTESILPAGAGSYLAQNLTELEAQIEDFECTLKVLCDLNDAAIAATRDERAGAAASLLIALSRYMDDLGQTHQRMTGIAAQLSAGAEGGA